MAGNRKNLVNYKNILKTPKKFGKYMDAIIDYHVGIHCQTDYDISKKL